MLLQLRKGTTLYGYTGDLKLGIESTFKVTRKEDGEYEFIEGKTLDDIGYGMSLEDDLS